MLLAVADASPVQIRQPAMRHPCPAPHKSHPSTIPIENLPATRRAEARNHNFSIRPVKTPADWIAAGEFVFDAPMLTAYRRSAAIGTT